MSTTTTTTTTVLSVDIGWRHLGIARLHIHEASRTCESIAFHLIDLVRRKSPITVELMVERLHTALVDVNPTDVDTVIIEQQPPKNRKGKILSHCVQMFFISTSTATIHFVNAKSKWRHVLRWQSAPTPTSYAKRKRLATTLVERYLRRCHWPLDGGTCLHQFLALRKKDDVADAILQGLCFYGVRWDDLWCDDGEAMVSNLKKVVA